MEKKKLTIERRDFLKSAGAFGAMGMLPLGILAGCSSTDTSQNTANAASNEETTAPAPSSVVAEDGRLLTLEEVNQLRQELIDSQTEDYVCEDGTVVPNLYVKLHALIHSTGMGLGNKLHDGSFKALMLDFNEEQAQAYLEMPWGEHFTATDFAYKSGRDEDECYEICEKMGKEGTLHRTWKGGVPYYYTLPEIHGFWEYGKQKFNPEYINAHKGMRPTPWEYFWDAGTPNYYAIPVSRDIVEGGEILPYDDLEKILDRNEVFGLCKCICVMQLEILETREDNGCEHELWKCMAIGEAAEFGIENGNCKQITREEARAHFQDSVEKGYVLQSCFSRETGSICSCHADHCGFLRSQKKLDAEFPKQNAYDKMSHYMLKVDKESCVKCGTCVDRCPLQTISIDDEGYPQVGPSCLSCGQCAYVCPQEARKLVQKEGEPFYLPEDYLEDANMKAEYRFRNGLISVE